MYIARIEVDEASREFVLADLQEAGTLGVTEVSEAVLEAWFADEATARRFSADVAPAPAVDWLAESRAAWVPRLVGERFFLAPPWSEEETPAGRIRLEYRAGMACGTGEHPATRLALMGLEQTVFPGCRVLDVGTGSGLLVEAAVALGAAFVVGCDIEEPDVRLARAAGGGEFFVGSARALRSESFDVVVANINPAALLLLLADLRRVMRPGGSLVVSGFRPWEFRLLVAQALELEGWQALVRRT